MSLSHEQDRQLKDFLARAEFTHGAVILDLDGTVLLEDRGNVIISNAVGDGIRAIRRLGRPIIINSLRFPRSVVGSIGRQWLSYSGERIPAVLMNGSLLGYVELLGDSLVFAEEESFPLRPEEILGLVHGLSELMNNNLRNILVFFYPRDWRKGEIIWTPHSYEVSEMSAKYVSASEVYSSPIEELAERMRTEETCMVFALVNHPRDTLMAYQHTWPECFFTSKGVDKISGQELMAERLGISLADSLGAGDTIMDSFLSRVGLAVIVGHADLPFTGLRETMRATGPDNLGEIMCELARLTERAPLLEYPYEDNRRHSQTDH